MLGCNGLLSGSGSVIPDLQSALFRAVRCNDLEEARRINDRIYPLARVFYSEPWVDMHNRMKEALVLLGRQKRAVARPPLTKIGDAEIARIRQARQRRACWARKPTPRSAPASEAMRDTHRTGWCLRNAGLLVARPNDQATFAFVR